MSSEGSRVQRSPALGLRGRHAVERPYRIVLPLTGDHPGTATVLGVLQHAADPGRLLVLGTRPDLNELSADLGGRSVPTYRTELRPTLIQALRQALAEAPGEDLLLVAPGMLPTPYFDARLCWSSCFHDAIAAISPLSDVDRLTSLRRFGLGDEDPVEVDDRLSRAGGAAVIDAPYVLPECVLLRVDRMTGLEESLERADDLVALTNMVRRNGLLVGLAPHVWVAASAEIRRPDPLVESPEVEIFLADSEIHQVAERFFETGKESRRSRVPYRSRPRILHVTHSLGGGLERWVRLFCTGDGGVENLILKSIGERGRFGSQLWLYDSPDAVRPLRTWKMARPIPATLSGHLGYRRATAELLRDFGIDGVIVSSLIGHSLDILDTGLPTTVLAHDYYPFCPALHIHFRDVCQTCGTSELAACLQQNDLLDLFDDRDPVGWQTVREAFLERLREGRVRLVAPSESVVRHYRTLVPDLADLALKVIPHGGGTGDIHPLPARSSDGRRLRVLVPGRLTRYKGSELLRRVAELCSDFADFHLLGCGDGWRREDGDNLFPRAHYQRPELPALLQDLEPDLALLLSIVPETFSFTLGECMAAAIPPVAVRLGSFEDRIEDGRTGFLCEPQAEAIADLLRDLAASRERLMEIQRRLQGWQERSASDMVSDYVRLLSLPGLSSRAYFSRVGLRSEDPSLGVQLPPSSPIGFRDFLRQVEEGTYHHLRETRRLGRWQRSVGTAVARSVFGTLHGLIRWL